MKRGKFKFICHIMASANVFSIAPKCFALNLQGLTTRKGLRNSILIFLMMVLCPLNSAGTIEDGKFVIDVNANNTLSTVLNEKELSVKELTINGVIGQNDFEFIKTLTNMYMLDMSNAILDVSMNNTIPSNIFVNNAVITNIKLPKNTKEVAAAAFEGMSSLRDVVLNDSIKNLHISAFNNCQKLENINFPYSLESICGSSFYNCQSLKSVILGKNVKDLMDYAFNKCINLEYVRVDGDINRLGEHAFSQNPMLKEVYLNGEVKKIGKFAFKDNTSLNKIRSAARYPQQVEPNAFYGVPKECVVEIPVGCMNKYTQMYGWKDLNLTEIALEQEVTVTEAGKLAEQCYGEKMLGSLVIKGPINGTDMRYIADKLFYLQSLNLKYVQIVKGGMFDKYMGIEWDKENAVPDGFMNGKDKLEEVILPSNIVEIGASAFSSCSSLKNFNFPRSLKVIGDYAFNNCSELTQLLLPAQLEKISLGAFMYCTKIKNISIGDNLMELADDAFGECTAIETIKVSDANEHFSALKNVLYTKDLSQLMLYPAARTGTEYTVNSNTKVIVPLAFKDAKNLKRITMSACVEEIGNSAFANTSSVESVFIANAKKIGQSCFAGMTALKEIYVSGYNPSKIVDTDPFSGGWMVPPVDKTKVTLFVPENVVDSYKNAQIWKDMLVTANKVESVKTVDIVTAGTLSEILGANVFYVEDLTISGELNGTDLQLLSDLSCLKKLNIAACTIVKGGMFAGKEWMKEMTLPDYWMENNKIITEVILPENLISIGQQSFGDCSLLTNVVIGSATKKINTGAFIRSGLKSIIIPDNVTSLGWASAFSECTSLEKLHLGKNLSSIGMHTFFGCTALKEITVSEGNTNFIAENNVLFDTQKTTLILYCLGGNATSYSIPVTVEIVDMEAFYGSVNLEKVLCNDGLKTIAMSAFAECKKLNEIVFPESLETIEMEAFLNCPLIKSIKLGNQLMTIESSAFKGCTALADVTIGSGITMIEEFAFAYCPNISSFTVEALTPADAFNAFTNEDDSSNIDFNKCILYVPAEVVEAYKTAEEWSKFVNIKEIKHYAPVMFLNTSLNVGDKVSMNIVADDNVFYIDLGDGNIIEQTAGYYKAKAVGSDIKIYGNVTSIVANWMSINDVKVLSENLELLNLNSNNLVSFELASANKLTTLSLESNKLESVILPDTLKSLKTLNVKRNSLTAFPYAVMPELETLMAGDNKIKEMDLSSYSKLQKVRVNKSGIETIVLPDSCVELHAEKNNLIFEGGEIKGFDRLVTLRLSGNKIKTLRVYECPMLKELELNDNGLENLTIENLESLNLLWLKNNELNCSVLNDIYSSLPVVSKGTVKVSGNVDAAIADSEIAEKKGWNIDVKGVPTAIDNIGAYDNVKSIYDSTGTKRYKLSNGINIVIMNDGTIKKILVK